MQCVLNELCTIFLFAFQNTKCLWSLPYAKAGDREEQVETLHAFGRGTKRSSLVLALSHSCVVTGLGAKLLMYQQSQRVCSRAAAGGSARGARDNSGVQRTDGLG